MRTLKLQDNIRLIASGGTEDRSIYLVEESPGYRLTTYAGNYYNLPLPWLYYLIVHNKIEVRLRMFGHNAPVKDRATMQAVYCSPRKIRRDGHGLDWLPIGASAPHQICDFGVTVSPEANRLEVIHSAINNFWSTNTRNYLHGPNNLLKALAPSTSSSARGSHVRNVAPTAYGEWEKLSVEEVLALPYENLITMGNLIEQVTKNTVKEVTRLNNYY